MAQNTDTTDYVACAEQLKNSIHRHMPDANVTIITDLPYGNLGGFQNDWQVYEASPYDYTIKLEADMVMTKNVDYWFDVLAIQSVVVCDTIRDYKGNISPVKAYREFTQVNNLPDVYNAMTFFKKSEEARQFFLLVRDIFEHWDDYKATLVCDTDEEVSTDWVYAIACHIMGIEKTTLPYDDFSMVHMKQLINNTATEDWTQSLVYELNDSVRVQTIPQLYPFHYHVKTFAKELEKHYG